MLFPIHTLNPIIEPGISLSKNEVLKRYRSLASYNALILRLLLMLPFSFLQKDESGNLFLV